MVEARRQGRIANGEDTRMTDSLGFRRKFAVIAPSTNTAVQPEFDAMRPRGVTNHFGRILIPNDPIRNDDDFNVLMDNIRKEMMNTVDQVMTCEPDYLIMGMSSETFWDGLEGSKQAAWSGSSSAPASRSRWARTPRRRRSSATAPSASPSSRPTCRPGDAQVRRFFTDCGFEIVKLKGLRGTSPVQYAHVSERELRDAINEVNGPDVDAIVQVGTNLAMARLAGIAEFWLDKPVLAINTCIYWWALRQNGIDDKIDGFGSLLIKH